MTPSGGVAVGAVLLGAVGRNLIIGSLALAAVIYADQVAGGANRRARLIDLEELNERIRGLWRRKLIDYKLAFRFLRISVPIGFVGAVLTGDLRQRPPAFVRIAFVVDRDGRVRDTYILQSTNEAFDEAVLDTVEGWRFEPGRKAGEAVAVRMQLPMRLPASTWRTRQSATTRPSAAWPASKRASTGLPGSRTAPLTRRPDAAAACWRR